MLQLGTTTDVETILTLMPLYYEFDHLKFDEAKALSTLKEFLSSPEFGRLWLILDPDSKQTIGYIILAFGYSFECGGREAFIDEFFIIENYRGKGIGSKVIEQVKENCIQLGIKAIRLEVTKSNQDVIRLYQKMGFQDLGRSLLTYWVDPNAVSV